jgi:hypothetical protein
MPSIYSPPSTGGGGGLLASALGNNTTANRTAFASTPPPKSAGTIRAAGGVITDVDEVNMTDLESLPFSTPIEMLINLWVARYGNEWVDVNEVLTDDFYGLAFKRLKSMGKLETHYLTNRSRFVCRKPA